MFHISGLRKLFWTVLNRRNCEFYLVLVIAVNVILILSITKTIERESLRGRPRRTGIRKSCNICLINKYWKIFHWVWISLYSIVLPMGKNLLIINRVLRSICQSCNICLINKSWKMSLGMNQLMHNCTTNG